MILERRAIHINLTKDVHSNFRLLCIEDRVTMQEIIEHFVNGLVDDQEEMVKIYKEFLELRRTRKINKIAKVEVDEIFNKILEDSDGEAF